MSGARVARNSVAFLILQNAAFVVGTAIIGLGALLNLIPTKAPLGLLLSSAVLSWILMVAVLIMAASAGACWCGCRSVWWRHSPAGPPRRAPRRAA
jgi:hypothetical protein